MRWFRGWSSDLAVPGTLSGKMPMDDLHESRDVGDRLRNPGQGGCLPKELLEAYAFNRMRSPEFALLEEHLLICRVCRSRLSEIEICIVFGFSPCSFLQKTDPRVIEHGPAPSVFR